MDAASLEQVKQITEQTVFLVGTSFLLGSLSTIFVLIMLDLLKMRRSRSKSDNTVSYDDAETLEIDDADK